MDISRRSFLGGALTVAATAVAGPVLGAIAVYPVLYGDGVHDDTVALNAFLNGDPVMIEGEVVKAGKTGYVNLTGGHFLMSGPLVLSGLRNKTIDGVRITTSSSLPAINLRPDCQDCALTNWWVELTSEQPYDHHQGVIQADWQVRAA